MSEDSVLKTHLTILRNQTTEIMEKGTVHCGGCGMLRGASQSELLGIDISALAEELSKPDKNHEINPQF